MMDGSKCDNEKSRFNRTFMELKYCLCGRLAVGQGGFNRTFMELKLLTDCKVAKSGFVLIVPLWN